ncbi:protein of unknown function [Shewanella benthica]|uniref:Uncharacterized protein n=1 Tax=Shewanella benthica TaxID=43661 RepID=A0A330LWZ0_9GAMM|nr:MULTISPECIES: hypothetical protein [Shewanella]MBL4814461.1 hypothetical protein [Shewanella sp.]MCJ8302047.1 hypothetical protein [Shewanella sp.]SQH74385.1 protein of unknown function [Shewanella benthica]
MTPTLTSNGGLKLKRVSTVTDTDEGMSVGLLVASLHSLSSGLRLAT